MGQKQEQRRKWERKQVVGTCPYEMSETIHDTSLVIHRGTAISINYSPGGMLILMDQAPRMDQVISLRVSSTTSAPEHPTLAEVRWTKTLMVEAEDGHHEMHLAGLRFLLGPEDKLRARLAPEGRVS